MKTYIDCFPCFMNQALVASRISSPEEKVHVKIMTRVMDMLRNMSFDTPPPSIARNMYKIIREETGNLDPYREIKLKDNREMMNIFPYLENVIENHGDSLKQACKLAIAGNQIDSGTGKRKETHDHKDIEEILNKTPVIDHFDAMKEGFLKSKSILYIGDNSGEIVLDRLFIEQIVRDFPKLNLIYAVRGQPVINDVTMTDAEFAGITDFCEVIDNGDSSPGTDLRYCSDKFKNYFNDADMVIAKGQGNYETLSGVKKENLYFLLMAKCHVIASHLECETGSTVIKNNSL
ncbi:MAG: damage-control phosphatase ARMT1 family protein [Elusimicrobiota bacterium]|nr:damage-control phosphatase ARMT1 family protein [Elusimicrobiota bacterium]